MASLSDKTSSIVGSSDDLQDLQRHHPPLGSEGKLYVGQDRDDASQARDSHVFVDPLNFDLTPYTTNASFADALCGYPDLTQYVSVNIENPGNRFFRIPDCFAGNATSLTSLYAVGVTIDNFHNLPSTITAFTCSGCIFLRSTDDPLGDASAYFFDPSGSLLLIKVLTVFNNPVSFAVDSTILYSKLDSLITLPSSMYLFQISNTALSGTIPYNMVPDVQRSDLVIDLHSNKLTGTIPEDFLDGSTWNTGGSSSFTLSLAFNSLTGSIPPDLLNDLAGPLLLTAVIDLRNNSLTGPIPDNFVPEDLLQGLSSFNLFLQSNQLNSTVPASFLANLPSVANIRFDASNNLLEGSLPSTFLPNGYQTSGGSLATLSISLRNNNLTGSIPPTFLTQSLKYANLSLNSLTLDLRQNRLEGSIPASLLYQQRVLTRDSSSDLKGAGSDSNFGNEVRLSRDELNVQAVARIYPISVTDLMQIFLDSNRLEGNVPPGLFDYFGQDSDYSYHCTLQLTASNNRLSGELPADLLSSASPAITAHQMDFSKNLLTGSLPSLCSGSPSIDVSSNYMSGSISSEWSSCQFTAISISGMNLITGTIPAGVLSSSTLNSFLASKTSLNGTLPPVSSTVNLDLSYTYIDFCNAASLSSISFATRTCTLAATNTCTCATEYTNAGCMTTSEICTPTISIPETTAPPALLPASSPSACSANTRPGPEFQCVAGVWTAPASNATTLIIPSGAGTVVITGNLTSASVVLQGLSTSVTIGGCASNLTSVQVELGPSELASLSSSKTLKTLITLGNQSCGTGLSDVEVSAVVKSGGCKKVKTQKVVTNSGTLLGAYFTLDKSGCKTWWIILVSVICGAILIAVIAVILLAVLYKPFREKIRPFSKSRRGDRAVV